MRLCKVNVRGVHQQVVLSGRLGCFVIHIWHMRDRYSSTAIEITSGTVHQSYQRKQSPRRTPSWWTAPNCPKICRQVRHGFCMVIFCGQWTVSSSWKLVDVQECGKQLGLRFFLGLPFEYSDRPHHHVKWKRRVIYSASSTYLRPGVYHQIMVRKPVLLIIVSLIKREYTIPWRYPR